MCGDRVAARRLALSAYDNEMEEMDERLARHLELCDRIARRLMAEGKWPWPDSPENQTHDRFDETDNIV